MCEQISLNFDWQFSIGKVRRANSKTYSVDLPHTPKQIPTSYIDYQSLQEGVYHYTKSFKLLKKYQNKRIFVKFEGVAQKSTIYINGTKVETNNCGYNAFEIELTQYIKFGSENILTVVTEGSSNLNQPPFGGAVDFLTYAGIYREVNLIIKDEVNIKGVFVVPSQKSFEAHFEVDFPQKNPITALRLSLFDSHQKIIKAKTINFVDSENTYRSGVINSVKPWDIDTPNLYELEISLLDKKNRELDTHRVRFGFREIEWKVDGFYLNGIRRQLRGLNRHQSFPIQGYAMPKRVQKLDAKILKNELGVNMVRTSHYMQSKHFLDACDELGLLVFSEVPGWQHISTDVTWQNQHLKNVDNMIREHRNHPSIVIWGIRINESPDNDDLYTKSNAIAHKLDPTRPTSGVRCFAKSNLIEDVFSFNDFSSGFPVGSKLSELKNKPSKLKPIAKLKKTTPDLTRPYLITENIGHTFPTKLFDNEARQTELALRHLQMHSVGKNIENLAGVLSWCAFDYHTRDSFGSGNNICHHGVMDIYRNPKFASHAYSVQKSISPILEVSSRMATGDWDAIAQDCVVVLSDTEYVQVWVKSNNTSEKQIKEKKTKNKKDKTASGDEKNEMTDKEGYVLVNTVYPAKEYDGIAHPPFIINDWYSGLISQLENMRIGKARRIVKLAKILMQKNQDNLCIKEKLFTIWALITGINKDLLWKIISKYLSPSEAEAKSYKFVGFRSDKAVIEKIIEPAKEINLKTDIDTQVLEVGDTYDIASLRISAVDQNGIALPYYFEPVTAKISGPFEIIGDTTISLVGGKGGFYIRTTNNASTSTQKDKKSASDKVKKSARGEVILSSPRTGETTIKLSLK